MSKQTTKKETDFWGNEKEVHYEDGKKVGETKFRETLFGNKVQDHYDTSGNKVGETRKEAGFFSDKAVHYDAGGNKQGYSKDDTTIFGNKIQKHYEKSGKQVGKSHYEEGFLGGHRKVHEGNYFKGRDQTGSAPDNGNSTDDGSYGDCSSSYSSISLKQHTTQSNISDSDSVKGILNSDHRIIHKADHRTMLIKSDHRNNHKK